LIGLLEVVFTNLGRSCAAAVEVTTTVIVSSNRKGKFFKFFKTSTPLIYLWMGKAGSGVMGTYLKHTAKNH
jgi:hypothetical protein